MTSLWRRAFDTFERPLASASESWVQSKTFMDLAAVAVRMQRRLAADGQRVTEQWLHAWGMPARGDLFRLMNQVAGLERQVRDLERELVQQVSLFENLWNDEFVEGFLAIGQWARDQVPFPGAAFRQTVSLLIRQNALCAGVIPLGRAEVRLKDIRCPFLNAFAEQDGITPAASSRPLTGLVGSEDASELRLHSGHIGFVAGRQAAKIARPQIADWIRQRSDEA